MTSFQVSLDSFFEKNKSVSCVNTIMQANIWFSYNRGNNNSINDQNALLEMVLGVQEICASILKNVLQTLDGCF